MGGINCKNRKRSADSTRLAVKLQPPCVSIAPRVLLGNVACPAIKAWRAPDDRIALTELLALHAKPIQALARELAPLINSHPAEDPLKIDDVFLLRYLLSFKSTEKAAASIKYALEYRRDEENLRNARSVADDHSSWLSLVSDFMPKNIIFPSLAVTFTSYGDWVGFIEIGTDEWLRMIEAMEPWMIIKHEKLIKELIYQYLDSETRKRGYLVKCYGAIDYTHFRWNMHTFRLTKGMLPVFGELSQFSSKLYPQMEAAVVLAGSPMLAWLVQLCKPFISERSLEKIRIESSMPHDILDGMRLSVPVGTACKIEDPLELRRALAKYGCEADYWSLCPTNCEVAETSQGKNPTVMNALAGWLSCGAGSCLFRKQ